MKLLRVNYLISGSSKVYVAHFKGPSWLPGYIVVSEIEEEVEVTDECYFDNNGQLRMHQSEVKSDLQRYGNTFFFSMDSPAEGDEIKNDLLIEGDISRLGAGVALQMLRHPDLVAFFEYCLHKYDILLEQVKTN